MTPNHTYPEPAESIRGEVEIALLEGGIARVQPAHGPCLDIEYLEGSGWCLEVRYDIWDSGFSRQEFTGVQASLPRRELSIAKNSGGEISLLAGTDSLSIDPITGTIRASHSGIEYWRSAGTPFFAHKEPVEILEEIQSRERPVWDEPTPFRTIPTLFETHMIRFQYPVPPGVILGLPGQCGEFNRRGYRYDLFNNDQPFHLPSRPQMYQSWPIVMHRDLHNEGWVGIFHDNPARTFVDLGDFYPDTILFESITNNTRVYIVRGAELSDLTRSFVALLGQSLFPPAWAFGYQQCRYSYMSSDIVRKVAKRLRECDIPCDAMYFDIDYMDGYRVFTRNQKTFGDLAQCLTDLKTDGFKSVCIMDPGVKVDPEYPAYQRIIEEKAAIQDKEGNPFEIICWPGKAVLPDFFTPEARSVWASLEQEWLTQFPFDGIWNDMNEPSNFDGGREKTATAYSTAGPIRSRYNLYGYYMALASAAGWSKANPGQRGVIISRSGYPGVQQHAVIWHGDNAAWWEHLRLAIDTCISYSLCGALYTGPDVPGFFDNPPDDLAIRFFQLGAFLPLFRGHSYKLTRNKEPFAFSHQSNQHIRDAIRLRYSLLREWYANFERCRSSGMPLMEPLLDPHGDPVRDAIVLFGKLLIAAVTTRDERARAIWLPRGRWYRLGEPTDAIEGGTWIVEPISIEKLPVFVRGGSILIRNEPKASVAETLSSREHFEVYPDDEGNAEGYWYGDDGVSINQDKAEKWRLFIRAGGEIDREKLPS